MVEINLFAFLNWFLRGFSFGCGFLGSVLFACLVWQFLKWICLDEKPKASAKEVQETEK